MYTLEVELPDKKYPILIERHLLKRIHEYLQPYASKKVVIITDQNVYSVVRNDIIYAIEKSKLNVHFVVVEPGEQSKSFNTLQKVYAELLDFEMTKSDLLIALGGGVIGDLTGFAAATYLRGISFIQIPTSLIAQVDSSIGGKTAVNLPQGKNLVGSFYHPDAVYIDPELLNSLEPRYLADGMAEVIKYGCIRDTELFSKLTHMETSALMEHMEEIIYKCCNIKRMIVEEDEKDTHTRMLLNFGHTIGHAIEKLFDFSKYTHGEGVAIGMYHMTKKSEEIGLTNNGTADKIKDLLIKYNLPYSLPDINQKLLAEAIAPDKKSRGNKLNLIVLKGIGNSFIHNIDKSDIIKYL